MAHNIETHILASVLCEFRVKIVGLLGKLPLRVLLDSWYQPYIFACRPRKQQAWPTNGSGACKGEWARVQGLDLRVYLANLGQFRYKPAIEGEVG